MERHYFLRLWIGKALYQKLVRAHGLVRQPDGSRAELSELLDMAFEALLAEASSSRVRRTLVDTRSQSLGAGFEAVPESEPSTVRAPTTIRWCPDAKG